MQKPHGSFREEAMTIYHFENSKMEDVSYISRFRLVSFRINCILREIYIYSFDKIRLLVSEK